MSNHTYFKSLTVITICLVSGLFSCKSTEHYKKVSIADKNSYSVFFNEKERKPFASYYTINKEDVEGVVKRKNIFYEDSSCSVATNEDFVKSGYDKGHLKPAAVSKGSVSEMKESFLLSNVAPQYPYFNRVTWRGIEADVRALLKNQDSLIVYTGVIYRKRAKRLNKKVEVPYYFYKTILLGDSSATIAFLAKNDSTSVKGFNYTTTVNIIEKLVRFDFYPGLNDKLED